MKPIRGSDESMNAGLAVDVARGMGFEDSVRLAAAAGSRNATARNSVAASGAGSIG